MADDATTGHDPRVDHDERQHPALENSFAEQTKTSGVDTIVFGVTAVLSLAFVIWGIVGTESLSSSASSGLSFVVHNFGWLFSLAASGFVVFVLWLALSKFGRIPLGRDGEGPEFRTPSWIAMMFSAGMGIGLMFYGVAEPLWHFIGPPPGTPGGDEALEVAMATTLFHWTLHPWAIYALAGLAIAYGVFRRGRSLLISSVFTPLIGDKAAGGWPGRVIDIFAIFATLFGSATSLGLGALQIGSGLQVVGWVGSVGNTLLILIIVVLTIAFIASAVSGVAKGIQWLSNTNMVLAVILAFFVFVAGPTVFILNLIPTTIGSYAQNLAMMAARTDASGGEDVQDWLASWTIFYWAWWISWTPFVGMFIARISRGRTIRQFVTGVLLTPSLVSLVWFAVFGGAALNFQENGTDLTENGEIASENMLFEMLSNLPFEGISSVLVIILVAIFFVSGADAASMVMGTLSERGTLEPSRWNVIFWGAATGAVAAIMLQIGGADALSGLQNITIIAALPFLVIMVGMAAALLRDLRADPITVRGRYATAAVEQAVVSGVSGHGDDFVIVVEPTEPGQGVGSTVDVPVDTSTGSQPVVVDSGATTTSTAADDGGQGRSVEPTDRR